MKNGIMKKYINYTLLFVLCIGIVHPAMAAEGDNTLLVQPDTVTYDENVPEEAADEEIAQLSEELEVWEDGARSDEDTSAEQEITDELIDEVVLEEETAAEEAKESLTETEIEEESEQYLVESGMGSEDLLTEDDIDYRQEVIVESIETEEYLEECSLDAAVETTGTIVQSGNCGENATWTLDDKGVLTISGTGRIGSGEVFSEYLDDVRTIIINEGINQIGEYTFENYLELEEIFFPSTVINIGEGAFHNCSNLKSVTLPDALTSIEGSTFSGCDSLESVSIPDSVISIGEDAFFGCRSLESIDLPAKMTYLGEGAFFDSGLESVRIPDGVKEINEYTFSYSDLSSIVLPSSVEKIGEQAFAYTKLGLLDIPAGVVDIGREAFASSSIFLIMISGQEVTISDDAFINTNLMRIYGNANSNAEDYAKKNGYDFCDIEVTGKEEVKELFSETTSIGYCGDQAISILDSKGVLRICGKGTLSVSWYSFDEIKQVIIEDGITEIPESAFYGCKNLSTVSIPESVTHIGESAFAYCGSLTSIIIPDSVTSISKATFHSCSSLELVSIPNGVTSIGEYAFARCTGLKTVMIPESVGNIGDCAFNECDNLISVTMSYGVSCIGENAFNGCSSLSTVNWSDSISHIGRQAFSDCSNLASVVVDEKGKSQAVAEKNDGILCDLAFSDCTSLKKLEIPGGITKIESYAVSIWSDSVSVSVSIPKNVTSIGEDAFCCSISNLYYGGTLSDWLRISFEDEFCNPMRIADKVYIDGKLLSGEIAVPKGADRVGKFAFTRCGEISSVTLSESVTSIDAWAFFFCKGLTSITIPASVKNIDWTAFCGTDLQMIYGYSGSAAENFSKENGYSFTELKAGKVTKRSKNSVVVGGTYSFYEKINGSKIYCMQLSFGDQNVGSVSGGGYSSEKTKYGSIEYNDKKYYMYAGAGSAFCYRVVGSKIETCYPGGTGRGKLTIKENGKLLVENSTGLCGDWGSCGKGDIFTHDHSWGDGKVTKKATCKKTGTRTYTCSCGETKTEKIAKTTDHTYGSWTTVSEATVSAAKVQKRTCSVCGKVEKRSKGSKLKPVLEVPGKLSSFKMQEGKTVKFALTMARGDTVNSVSSSKAKSMKVADYDKKGNITLKAVEKGKAKVTFTLESGKKRTYTVSVVDAAVKTTGIRVNSTKLTLAEGKTKTLKPVLEQFTSTQKVTYVSSNKKVATVSSAGKVKAAGVGKASITVKSGSKSVKVTVTVPGIAIVKSSAVVKKGKTLTLQPELYGISEKITYTSSNKKVATVTSAGKVKGIKKGTATITVKAGKYSAKCKVTVK